MNQHLLLPLSFILCINFSIFPVVFHDLSHLYLDSKYKIPINNSTITFLFVNKIDTSSNQKKEKVISTKSVFSRNSSKNFSFTFSHI